MVKDFTRLLRPRNRLRRPSVRRVVSSALRDLSALPHGFAAHRVASWQRRWLYPVLGFILAQGAPIGLLLTRALQDGVLAWMVLSSTWLFEELMADWPAYAYLLVSTTTVFVTLGWVLGLQQDRLRRLAITDGLTGLRNRRYFSSRLAEELARAKRYHTPLSLLILDLDWLKTINDSHGHEAGDRAIKGVAAVMETTLRATDLGARYAGDEFAALLPQTTAQEALGLARRIGQRVRALGYGPQGSPLSVSIGVADLDGAGSDSAEDLFTAADEALYAAKAAGRDSVVAAPALRLALVNQ